MLASTVKFSRYVRSRTQIDACSPTASGSSVDTVRGKQPKLIPQDPTVCQARSRPLLEVPAPKGVLTSIVNDRPTSRRPLVSCTAWNERPRTAQWTPRTKPDSQMLLRKEVIQPHLPVRLPCYDFVPIASPTFDGSLHKGWATGFGCCRLS